ncbi:MAG: hypothetical protein AAF657_17365 [Acidobacteriota bacterium]
MQEKRISIGWILVGIALAVAGCQKEEPPAPPPSVRVENPQLGMAIAALAPDFEVTANDGQTIELKPTGEAATGTVTVLAGEPETGGINLVAAVQQHKVEILEHPDGDYKGQAEYVSPLGTTFASRGRYTEGGATVEERVIYMVHPKGDRTLQVVYLYPAGDDTQARLDALMNGIVGELEELPAAPPPAAE